jgi:septal ring factor EnvC (AmiA/AmiB activator)
VSGGPETGAGILGVIYALGHIVVVVSKWLKDRERKRAMESVPPTELALPPPATDRAVLARMDRADQDDALVTALLKARDDLMDERRKVEVLRAENSKLAFRLHALEQETARKRVQLRAERLATRTLREQLSHVEKELAEARGELELAHADLRRALLVRE